MSNKFSRCARLISLALVIASLCSAPLSAIVCGDDKPPSQQIGDNKSESKQDGVKIELDASESSTAEAAQPANVEKNLLLATRPRMVSSRLSAPPVFESPKPEAEKPSANILNTVCASAFKRAKSARLCQRVLDDRISPRRNQVHGQALAHASIPESRAAFLCA